MSDYFRKVEHSATFHPDKAAKADLWAGERLFVGLNCFEPGQTQKVHAHAASDKVYLCLRGRLVATVGDAQVTLEPGEAVHAPAGVVHGIENREKADGVAYVVTAPRP